MKSTLRVTHKLLPSEFKKMNKKNLQRAATLSPRMRPRGISRDDMTSLASDNNFSDFDEALAKNHMLELAAKAEGYKT